MNEEGVKNIFYLTTHSTHFIYGVRHMVNDHTDSQIGNPLPPHELLLRLAARFILYASSHRHGIT